MSIRSNVLLISAFLGFSFFAQAQSFPASQGDDAQQSVDCTDPDPANATSANCVSGSGQSGDQTGYSGSRQYQNGQAISGRPGMGNGPQNGPTYSDNGGATRNANGAAAPTAPPEPLTEFQKLIASTTGQVLPIFGHDLFRGVPSTFAPVDQIPVTPDYVIGPGDEIRIRVWGQVNFNADLKVDRSGDIYIPQVGGIHVTGSPFSDLSRQIRSQIARVYRNFDLTVDLGQLRSIQIFVVGQARRPGAYTVSSLSTLVNALFASGGPSVQGTMRDIQLKREGKVVTRFDLYDLLIRGDKSKDARLLPGDVIFIPAARAQVALSGSVRKPAIYELNHGDLNGELSGGEAVTTLQQLLDSAGGLSSVASSSRISIERIDDQAGERQMREAMEVAPDAAGLATALRDGDVIRVLPIVPGFQKTVILRGNLANPGRFAWHEGMKLSDLIPDRPSLITRNYWWRRAQLGLPSPEFQPLQGRGPLYQPGNPGYLAPRKSLLAGETQALSGQANPSGQTNPSSQANLSGQTNLSSQNDPPYVQEPPQPVPVSGLPANASGTQVGGDSQQSPRSLSAQEEASGSTLAGQQSGVVTQNVAAATGKIEVKLSAPEIDWNYAVVERLDPDTLKTSLLPFNLGKLVVDHDASQDMLLRPGDVVTIFSQADIRVPLDQQTKFVKLEGEFASAGVYSVAPGETLRDVVRRAGGFTRNAYIFGSEFTRESTRVFQQQRLDEYVQSLELQIQRGALNQAASAVTPQDAAGANASALNQQALLVKLRQLRATGRIVLEVKPDSQGLDSIPDIQLQDDDRFVVPSVPATVNVVGAVYDQNSFLYGTDRRVGDYLRLAGGPNRDADKSHIFIIRADGSVVSRQSANGLWGNNFLATRMNPGDSIIVPQKVLGASLIREFINWSQVFSQLALGAAAVSVLHN